jgi:hypothetical protein
MVEEPSHVKQLSLTHVCKIGLICVSKIFTGLMGVSCSLVWEMHYIPAVLKYSHTMVPLLLNTRSLIVYMSLILILLKLDVNSDLATLTINATVL